MTSKCVEWKYRRTRHGYGIVDLGTGKMFLTHRLSYEYHHGVRLTWKQHVLHSCDNPPCINPEHLFLGDQRMNNADRDKKGRQAKGVTNGKSRLTEEQVREILETTLPTSYFMKKFNMTETHVLKIRRGQLWKHLILSPEAEARRSMAFTRTPTPRSLSDDAVAFIRSSTDKITTLAKHFGVSTNTIRKVQTYKTYKHLP